MSASASTSTHDRGHHKIGPTAHVTAYAWYQLGLPYGNLFTTREGATMYWAFRGATEAGIRWFKFPSLLDFLEFRHRMMEAQLDLIDPDRIVELGAGLSRRGVTWVLDRGVRYTEIDLPHMTAAKRSMLERGPGRVLRAVRDGELELRSTDILAPGFAAELTELLAGAKRPVVISEGMIDYFELSDRELLLQNIAAGLRGTGVGGHYMTDVHRADRERNYGPGPSVMRVAIKLATKGQGPAEPFRNLEQVERTFALAGFDEGHELRPKELAEREPRLKRLKSPTSVWLARVEPTARSNP
jgi:O-methyltransferase involved in polyketide biosynthesis